MYKTYVTALEFRGKSVHCRSKTVLLALLNDLLHKVLASMERDNKEQVNAIRYRQ